MADSQQHTLSFVEQGPLIAFQPDMVHVFDDLSFNETLSYVLSQYSYDQCPEGGPTDTSNYIPDLSSSNVEGLDTTLFDSMAIPEDPFPQTIENDPSNEEVESTMILGES